MVRLGMAVHDAFIKLFHFSCDIMPAKILQYEAPPCDSNALPEWIAFENSDDRIGNRTRIAGIDEKNVLSVPELAFPEQILGNVAHHGVWQGWAGSR
jgi:hypothetical protein